MKVNTGINGSTLKWIAIITMFIDHIGAVLLEAFVLNSWGTSPLGTRFYEQWNQIYNVDMLLRYVGRIAFPIYCFLLVEGFLHTRDVRKYAIRLGIFALISEVPFDLALCVQPINWQYQNVFFTLLIGLLTMEMVRRYESSAVGRVAGTLGGCLLAELMCTDYGAFGVALIMVLYFMRSDRGKQCLLGALVSLWEGMPTTMLAFIPIYYYDGSRGRQAKWFFYWFYPVHLLLLYMIGAFVLPMITG